MHPTDIPYADLINKGPAVLYTRGAADPWDFTFIGTNAALLLGTDAHSIMAEPTYWRTHIHEDDLDGIGAALADMQPGVPLVLEYRFLLPDGSWLWISDHLLPAKTDDGHMRCLGCLHAITRLKQAHESLLESEKRYRRVSDNVRDMVLQVDLKGVAYFASASHLDALGISAADMIGMNAYELVHPDDLEKILPVIHESIARRRPAKFEYRSRHGDGHYFWTEANANPLIEDDGRITGAILVTRDITEKKTAEEALKKAHDELEEKVRERTTELWQANAELQQEIEERARTEARLRESEERYRSIVENTHDGIAIVDQDFRVVYANPEMGIISGYSAIEELGRDFTAFLDEPSREEALRRNLKRRRGEDVPAVYEVTLLRKDGEKRTGEVRVSLFRDSAGALRSVVHFLDITARKRAEVALVKQKQELEAKNRELEELNTALKVLLNQREKDKTHLEENITSNVNGLILPHIEKIKRGALDERMRACLATIEADLMDIVSPFSRQLGSNYPNLTPREIQIASLIKEGRDSKEIADLLDLSLPTIEFHRNNLRKKLKLRNRKINLRSYLLTLK
ncbi:MAG: PAS domain S-box protein [Syntrophaceae bacterium]